MNVWEYCERFGLDPENVWDRQYTIILFANAYQSQKTARDNWITKHPKK